MSIVLLLSALSLAVSCVLALGILPKIIKIAHAKKLLDEVDERKVHHVPVPRLGGTAFVPVLIVTLYALCAIYPSGCSMNEFCGFVAAMMLINVVGIYDDLMGVRYAVKFSVQIVSGILLCLSGFGLTSFNGLFGITDLPVVVSWLLTLFLVVFVVNAINLIDGVDGLAASLSIVALAMLGGVLMVVAPFYAWLAAAGIGVLLAFLRYNIWGSAEQKTKLFMGDGGSQALGFLIVFLLLAINREGTIYLLSDTPLNPIVLGLAAVAVPCLDVVRVGLLRLYLGRHPFLPDRNHIHHCFLRLGYSHKRVVCYLLMIALGFIVYNLGMAQLIGPTWVFLSDWVLWLCIHLVLTYVVFKYERRKCCF